MTCLKQVISQGLQYCYFQIYNSDSYAYNLAKMSTIEYKFTKIINFISNKIK